MNHSARQRGSPTPRLRGEPLECSDLPPLSTKPAHHPIAQARSAPQIEIHAAHPVTFGLSPHFSVVTFHLFVMPPAVNDPPCCSTSSAYPRSAVTHEERNDEGSPFDCLSHTLSAPHRSCPTCPVPVLANRCFPSRTSNQNRRHTLRLSPKLVVEALCTPSSWGELGDET